MESVEYYRDVPIVQIEEIHCSAATFCFLVPLLIEPALATLQHKFLPTNCTTISGDHVT